MSNKQILNWKYKLWHIIYWKYIQKLNVNTHIKYAVWYAAKWDGLIDKMSNKLIFKTSKY